jgi:transposase
MRYQLTDHEWVAIKPMLPNKPRGVARVNDRRILNCIFWVLRSGAPWRDLPDSFGPYTTFYNRFVHWRAGERGCTDNRRVHCRVMMLGYGSEVHHAFLRAGKHGPSRRSP